MSDEIIDVAAREYTTSVRNELKGDLAALAARVRQLETRPSPNADGLTRDQVWQLVIDGIYAQLTTPGTPLYAATQRDVDDAEARLLALVSQLRLGIVMEKQS